MVRSPTCPQCNIRITRLFKVFVSFGTELDERNCDNDEKDREIAILKSQITAFEEAESDMKE